MKLTLEYRELTIKLVIPPVLIMLILKALHFIAM